jgi:hypothetical protein
MSKRIGRIQADIEDDQTLKMQIMPSDFVTVGRFKNGTERDMRLFLEMLGAEVVISPGQSVELLARPSEGLLPVTIDYVDGGLQIHPHQEFDPDWHVLFKGKLLQAGFPTVLSDHEKP